MQQFNVKKGSCTIKMAEKLDKNEIMKQTIFQVELTKNTIKKS